MLLFETLVFLLQLLKQRADLHLLGRPHVHDLGITLLTGRTYRLFLVAAFASLEVGADDVAAARGSHPLWLDGEKALRSGGFWLPESKIVESNQLVAKEVGVVVGGRWQLCSWSRWNAKIEFDVTSGR